MSVQQIGRTPASHQARYWTRTSHLSRFSSIPAFSYFLAICIWGGEFNFGMKSVAPISDVLRPPESPDLNWNLADKSSNLGYSYW